MRRVSLCLALAACLVIGVAAVPVLAAPKEPTGDRISLTLGCWDNCEMPQVFPADTPFYVAHGHVVMPALGDNPALGKYDFRLEVDGVPVAADYRQLTGTGQREHSIAWTYNFPDGLSGDHLLTGHWLVPCSASYPECAGLPKSAVVEMLVLTVPVSFE